MKNVINIGITINFDKNFFSNGLQQNIIFLNNLFNQIDDTCCYLLWQGSKINEKIVDKKLCFPYKNILLNDSIDFDLIIILAWNFSSPIIEKLKENIKDRNYKIIIPFPKLKIIN